MAYELENFCEDCRNVLKSGKPIEVNVQEIAGSLAKLLANPGFIEATFMAGDEFSKKELFHDPDTDFHVLAHVQQGPKEGPPHSHGASWAVYGTAMGVTGMKEWRRVNPDTEENVVLEVADRYDLGKGETRGYGPHQIHSTIHPAKAWVIRITGTNLDSLPRYRFNRNRDRIKDAA